MLSAAQGAKLVGLARNTIADRFSLVKFRMTKKIETEFSDRFGCFVTLRKEGKLRGCIGYPEPLYALYEGVQRAALGAAFKDPRFGPLDKEEVSLIDIEVSVLSKPQRVDVRNPSEYLEKIAVGKDGIQIRSTFTSGLLLPQVAVEQSWDSLTFLRHACLKAQLQADDWQDFGQVRVYTFQSQVFGESSPGGDIIQVM